MSNSKFVMTRKICNVQIRLMEIEIKDISFNSLLPLIFKECLKENLTFYFNFIENHCVLNLRDVEHENYELNIRVYYTNNLTFEELKRQALINAFLITTGKSEMELSSKDASSAKPIISGDKPTPTHISKAIETLNAKGVPITVESIRNHLPLGQMGTSARLECNKYLKQMRESQ